MPAVEPAAAAAAAVAAVAAADSRTSAGTGAVAAAWAYAAGTFEGRADRDQTAVVQTAHKEVTAWAAVGNCPCLGHPCFGRLTVLQTSLAQELVRRRAAEGMWSFLSAELRSRLQPQIADVKSAVLLTCVCVCICGELQQPTKCLLHA